MTAPDAHRQALAESRFFAHLATLALGVAGLAVAALAAPGVAWWAGWIAAVWTVAVTLHGVRTFWPFGDAWVARRVSALRGGIGEAEAYGLFDEALRAHAEPEGTAATLRALRARVEALERRAPAGAPDPFDLATAGAAGRPWAAEAVDGRAIGDLDDWGGVRQPIDTPRLDTPTRRSRRPQTS